jgi:HTH-type transcriptional regulator/antitoxin HigA
MASSSANRYLPDQVSPPGETLLETLESLGMSQADLAERTGRPRKTINEIIKGKAAITAETALQLERVLGVPASFWINRERQYQESQARLEEADRLIADKEWLRCFPIREMARWSWIVQHKDPVHQLRELLNFFGVASPRQWEAVWAGTCISLRKSATFECGIEALTAWLRRGELEARSVESKPYDPDLFHNVLVEVRKRTIDPPGKFQLELHRLCADAGVAVVFIPEIPKTRASGATRWLSPAKALLQLSLRYKTDDQLWFTFFHEAGHILLHGKRNFFIEGVTPSDSYEDEANRFAADFMIPQMPLREFMQSGDRSKRAIESFAEKLGIAPGIIVGRLQHERYIPPSHCNDLKRHFQWAAAQREDANEPRL